MGPLTPTDQFRHLVATAMNNGWDAFLADKEILKWDITGGQLLIEVVDARFFYSETEVLFNHSFAKALWGEDQMSWADDLNTDDDARPTVFAFSIKHGPRYKYALTHLAPEEDRLSWAIEYLKKMEDERVSQARFHADTQANATEEE